MPGRRWSDGLHQAVEAKEGVADPAREPDARVDHVPELLPHVRQARRHDRHGGHRGVRVPADLPPRDGRDPDAPCRWSARTRTTWSSARSRRRSTRSSPTSRTATSAASRCSSARRRSRTPSCCRGYLEKEKLPHDVLNAKQHAREAEIVAQAGRPEGDHDRHQHGGPRHRHRARRQHRAADPQAARRRDAARRTRRSARSTSCAPSGRCGTTRWSRPAACTSSAPSATSRGASTTSCAAASGRQGDPGSLALLPVARGSAAAHLRRRAPRRDHAAAQDARGRADRASDRHPLDREGAAPRRGAQLRHPQAAARVRRRRQRPAPRHLPAAQRAARRRRHRRDDRAT